MNSNRSCRAVALAAVLLLSVFAPGQATIASSSTALEQSGPSPSARDTLKSFEDAILSSFASFATSGAANGLVKLAPPARAALPVEAVAASSGGCHSVTSATQQRAGRLETGGDDSRHGDAASRRRQGFSTSTQALAPPHKLLWPLSSSDIALFTLTAITLFIAAGGGIGGGAVFVPLYVFLGGFTAPQAVALSNITILGGAVANFLANTSRRHPVLDRPLIDWDLIMVMEPTTMLGALLGGYLNKLFPVWLTSCLLAALLTMLTYKLLKRGASTYAAETRHQRLQLLVQQLDAEKQQQHAVEAVAVANGLQEPLLAGGIMDAAEEDIGFISSGGARQLSVTVKSGVTDNVSAAWFDTGVTDDQQAYNASQHHHHHQQQQQYYVPPAFAAVGPPAGCVDDAYADAVVVPVPAHLRPLNITTQEQAMREEQQLQRTPRSSHHSGSGRIMNLLSPCLQQQRQPGLSSPSGVVVDSNRAALLLPHQQQRPCVDSCLQPAAILTSSSSSSSTTCWCLSSCCSCFNPSKLKMSTVQSYERQQLPWQPLLTLFFLSAWVVISDTSKAAMVCGSLQYWWVVLSVVPPAALVMLLVRQWLLTKIAVKEAARAAALDPFEVLGLGWQQQQQQCSPVYEVASPPRSATVTAGSSSTGFGGIHWTPRNSLLYPMLCSAAGIVAGLFGVGGGIVKGPLMLELGVCPEVSAATSATMIMFTAGSAAVVYINFGGVVSDYALALLATGFLVTLLGQLFTIQIVKALGRRSIIIFMMGTLMVLATVAASFQSVFAVEAAAHDPRGLWTWGSVCKNH